MRILQSHVSCTTILLLITSLPLSARAHGDIHERIDTATVAIEHNPTNARLYLVRGDLHCEHEEYAEATADFNHAEELDPTLAAVDFSRARLLLQAGEPAAAGAKLDKYLKRVPSDGKALVERARLLARLNEREQAIADFTRALTLLREPPPEVYLDRARIQMGTGQPDAALLGLDEGIKALGPVVTLQMFAVELELSRTNYDSAVARLDTIINQSERKELWLMKRGDILVRAGKTPAAQESYRSALDAIHALPERLQESEAIIQLQRRVEHALNGLTNAPTGIKP